MSTVTTTKSVRVPTTAAEVWSVLARFDRISEWAPNVDHSTMTTEAHGGVGAARRVQVGRNVLIETVTEWEPDHGLAYAIDGLPPFVASVSNAWRLDAVVGGTLVSLRTTIDPGPTPTGRVGARVLAAVMGRASRQMLAGLEAQPWPGLPLSGRRGAADRTGRA